MTRNPFATCVVSDTGDRYSFATWRKAVRFALAAEFNVERLIDENGHEYAFDYRGKLHRLDNAPDSPVE